MGRWNKTIMGGDTPLDIEGAIYDICGVEMFPSDEDKVEIPTKVLELKQKEILKHKNVIGRDAEGDGPMVLAVMMMRVGAAMTLKTKTTAIRAAQDDEWAQDDKERKKYIDEFIKALDNYDNKTPTEITEEGLFTAIAKHVATDKKGGLVNKFKPKKSKK